MTGGSGTTVTMNPAMAVSTEKKARPGLSGAVSRGVLGFGLLSLGLLISGCPSSAGEVRRNAPPAAPADPFLSAKAKETGGDFSRLSSADQAKVDAMTHGHGAQALRAALPMPPRR